MKPVSVVVNVIIPAVLIVLFLVLIILINRGYDFVGVGAGTGNPTCEGSYTEMANPYPSQKGFCLNQSDCILTHNEDQTNKSVALKKWTQTKNFQDLMDGSKGICTNDFSDFAVNPGTTAELCCINGFTTCFTLQSQIQTLGLDTYLGFVRVFTPGIVQHSPIGFAQNPDTPYLTFPVPQFGVKPYLALNDVSSESEACTSDVTDMFDLESSGLDENVAGLALAPLGAVFLPLTSALVISITTPPGYFDSTTGLPTGCKYFSMTPNLGLVGDPEGEMYQAGISFSSIGYAYNLYDIQRDLIANGATDTSPFSKKILVIYTANKTLAEQINSVATGYDLVTALPIPSGTTFGEGTDMYGQPLLDSSRSNSEIDESTSLVDTSRCMMVSPVMRVAGSSEEISAWYKQAEANETCTILGVVGSGDGEEFTLSDLSGKFTTDGWASDTTGTNPNITPTFTYKRQLPAFTPEDPYTANVEAVYQTLRKDMEDSGFDTVHEIDIYRGTFAKWGEDTLWNQVGFLTRNYGIQAEGDCPDTYYPVSKAICVGPNQVAVAIAVNHTALGNSCYNTVAWYDTASVTSIGKTVSNDLPCTIDENVVISGVSRTDYRCSAPSPLLDGGRMQFCPTGTHKEVLGAPPSVPLLTMERMYCNPYVLVPTSVVLANGGSVDSDDYARGDPDADYDPTQLGTLDSTDIPPGTVLRRAYDYPQYAAPQSIRSSTALPFRVFVFSATKGTPAPPSSCVDVSTCQDITDGTEMGDYTCVANPDQLSCPNDGVVATSEVMASKQKKNFIRAEIMLYGNHKEQYELTGVAYLSLSIVGLIAILIAFVTVIFLDPEKSFSLGSAFSSASTGKKVSLASYVLAGILAVVAVVMAGVRWRRAQYEDQFSLSNASKQATAISNKV